MSSSARIVLPETLSMMRKAIPTVEVSITSRDHIPQIMLGLQHIYTTPPLCDAVFEILQEVVPQKVGKDKEEVVRTDTGRPGMDQWKILVLGALRLGLNTDYDRIQELANQHRTIRKMLGYGIMDEEESYSLQTIKCNLTLFTPIGSSKTIIDSAKSVVPTETA